MLRSFVLSTTVMLSMVSGALASLQLDLAGSSTDYTLETSIPNNNDFKSKLTSLGFVQIFKGDVKITEAGTLTFYAHASESGFTNTFSMGLMPNTVTTTETTDINPWVDNPISFGSIPVAGPTSFSALAAIFTTTGSGGLNAPIKGVNDQGFGIFAKSDWVNGTLVDQLFFGYDDNGAGPDDNHDDLIIRVDFRPLVSPPPPEAPEPISGIVWCGLAMAAASVPAAARRRSA